MSLADWLTAFRALHEKARRGTLDEAGAAAYRAGRDELARALLAAQQLALKPGETARQALRVALALQVDLETRITSARAITLDVSTGGFAALMGKVPPRDEDLECTLRLPGQDPLKAAARVVDAKQLPGNVRVAFAFRNLSDEDRERLETALFDSVLEQLDRAARR